MVLRIEMCSNHKNWSAVKVVRRFGLTFRLSMRGGMSRADAEGLASQLGKRHLVMWRI